MLAHPAERFLFHQHGYRIVPDTQHFRDDFGKYIGLFYRFMSAPEPDVDIRTLSPEERSADEELVGDGVFSYNGLVVQHIHWELMKAFAAGDGDKLEELATRQQRLIEPLLQLENLLSDLAQTDYVKRHLKGTVLQDGDLVAEPREVENYKRGLRMWHKNLAVN
jgi:dihydrodipicolinate synthase/N-acetylneuraminate lyase